MPSYDIAQRLPMVPNVGGKYAFIQTDQLHRNLNEKGFAFKFTCNNDERVYYNAYFLKQVVTYSDSYSTKMSGLEVHYDIDIVDCNKLSRDFKDITEDDIMKVVDQLMPLCIERMNRGTINNTDILFNVNMI